MSLTVISSGLLCCLIRMKSINAWILRKYDSFLFYTVIKGARHRISPGNIERIINKYADSIRGEFPNLPDKVYPHMFRRTRATNLYQSGVALELVSRILGAQLHGNHQNLRRPVN